MLPADAIGMLNVTDEIDASGEHRPTRDIEIGDPETDHWASLEERVERIAGSEELEERPVRDFEPDQIVGLPRDRDAERVAE